MRKVLVALLAASLVVLAVGSTASAGQRSPFPGDKLDLTSVPDGFEPGEAAAAIGKAKATGKGKAPRVGPNTQVNAPQDPLFGRSETTLTALNGEKKLVAGWNDAQGFCGPPFGVACAQQVPHGLSGYGYSTDGGLTWTDGGGPDPFGDVLSRGDPWLDDDGKTVYYSNLAVDATTGADLGIGVWRGDFDGKSFGWDDVTVFNSPNGADDFYDKEAIVVGKGKSKGDAYVSLTNFIEICGQPQFGFGQIEVWRTHDGGDSWQGPAIAGPEQADSVADCGNTGTLQQSSAPAIGPKGEVYVVWQIGPFFGTSSVGTGAAVGFAASFDGGMTFTAPATIASTNSMRQNSPIAYNRSRINDHPRISVADSGKYKGRIYVTYYSALAPTGPEPSVACPPSPPAVACVGQNLTSSQVYVIHSDDQGATWSTPTEVAPTPPATGVKRWWPDIDTDDKYIHVVYYESLEQQATPAADVECNVALGGGLRRVGPNSSLVDSWWTSSKDGGATWSMPLKVSNVTTNWCAVVSNIRPNMGDYNDTEAGKGHTFMTTWADGRNGIPDTFFAAGKAK